MRCFIAAMLALVILGCASLQPHAKVNQRATTQPVGKMNASVLAPVGGAVSAAISANREVGSNTAGAQSPAYTVVNSPWPTVAFGLGCGLLLILWQHEKWSHRRTKRAMNKGGSASLGHWPGG